MSDFLFEGVVDAYGNLSNIDSLIKCTPAKFKEDEDYYDYVNNLFMNGGAVIDLGWTRKEEFPETLWNYMNTTFKAVMGAKKVEVRKKIALATWMLSVMVEEVPSIPRKVANL